MQPVLEDIVRAQVTRQRPSEILRYLRIFGYDPELSSLHVFRSEVLDLEGGRIQLVQSGEDLVALGRSHDPVCGFFVRRNEPRLVLGEDYLGCLASSDETRVAPHEAIPLDFTPAGLAYPDEWLRMFGRTAFVIALEPEGASHRVPPPYDMLHRIAPAKSVKEEWLFLDELERGDGEPESTYHGRRALVH